MGDLVRYRAKRRAEATPEPPGGESAPAVAGEPLLFVVQQHAARRTHFDLRLEWDGVLLSWAVPKSPSYDPREKPLAVRTEDHPLEYSDFEGMIPAGNYGAGAMIVWDRGRWRPLLDPNEGLRSGKLLFELSGYKLRGVWTLVRMKKDPTAWLFLKERDAWARADAPPFDPGSVLSGLSVEELRDGAGRAAALRQEVERLGVPRRRLRVEDVKPMLAEPRREPFSRANWIFELKYDGFRVLAGREPAKAPVESRTTPGPRHGESRPLHAGAVRLLYRSGKDGTRFFPEVARALAALPAEDAILDGEVVVLDERGRPSFQLLQKRAQLHRAVDIARGAVERPAAYFVFDLLAFDGFDLRGLPLVERKRLLRELLPRSGPVRFADHVEERGEELFESVRAVGVEGVVGKKADSPYRAGRFAEWIKVRADHEDDFVVVGFTRPQGSRAGFGALHLAAYAAEDGADAQSGTTGRLIYLGRAGSGFTDRQLKDLIAEFESAKRPTAPCEGAVPVGQDHTWVEPRWVATVRYVEATEAGQLRQPVFLRLREDKAPRECVLPDAVLRTVPGVIADGSSPAAGGAPDNDPPRSPGPAAPASPGRTPRASAASAKSPGRLQLSNLDKIFWPEEGYTKGDLLAYYRAIAPWMLPYLRGRPLVLDRFPDGVGGKSFFQKNAPAGTPPWVRTVALPSDDVGREIDYFVCDDEEMLLYLVNLGTIPFHVWASRLERLDRPDWSILDLDPKGAPFENVVRVANALRRLCDEIELPAFLKTSGSSGLHVLVPLGGAAGFEAARQLAQLLASVVVQDLRDIATLERTIAARGGRVYLDYLQNGEGKLLVAPFSARPVAAAKVSMPLRWSEANGRLALGQFTIRNAARRMEKLGADPLAGVLAERPDLPAVLERLATRVARIQ